MVELVAAGANFLGCSWRSLSRWPHCAEVEHAAVGPECGLHVAFVDETGLGAAGEWASTVFGHIVPDLVHKLIVIAETLRLTCYAALHLLPQPAPLRSRVLAAEVHHMRLLGPVLQCEPFWLRLACLVAFSLAQRRCVLDSEGRGCCE